MSIMNIAINDKERSILQSFIGKNFDKYRCDPFIYSPSVFGVVGLSIDGKTYKITSMLESVRRFFEITDVSVFHILEASPDEIVSRMDGGTMIDTPVLDTIDRIAIVNDYETVTTASEDNCLISTKGIIFYMASGNEISMEIDTWFSEFITIRRGYGLIEHFTPCDDFIEEWSGYDSYSAKCRREILTLTRDDITNALE